ncbi:hypothetical protein SDC9_87950 [bioreactor metagenome]|uniref:DUF4843 domain-containing protein n=1 Tax=bioreactor metagenome TaxID=1076179 RepID=A0A644ZK96_9ZZZZ
MKNKPIIIFCLFIFLGMLQACEKEGFYYQDEARIRIEGPEKWVVKTDSLEFSFVTSPPEVSEITMDVTLHVMGNAQNHDRVVNLTVVQGKTTAGSNHYTLPLQVTIPANELSAIMPVVLKRTPDLQENTVRLYIEVAESQDFKPGVKERDHILIKWNDILTMPKNWDDLEEFFGNFSIVKYRFIINITGVSEFDTSVMSWAQLMNYKIMLKNALDQHNAANPTNPLTDENGQFITF